MNTGIQLPDIYVDSVKHGPTMSVNVLGIDATNGTVTKEKNNEEKEI